MTEFKNEKVTEVKLIGQAICNHEIAEDAYDWTLAVGFPNQVTEATFQTFDDAARWVYEFINEAEEWIKLADAEEVKGLTLLGCHQPLDGHVIVWNRGSIYTGFGDRYDPEIWMSSHGGPWVAQKDSKQPPRKIKEDATA